MPGARLLGDLLTLNGEIKRTRLGLRHLLILRHFRAAGARLRNRRRTKRNLFNIFCSLSQRKKAASERNIHLNVYAISKTVPATLGSSRGILWLCVIFKPKPQ